MTKDIYPIEGGDGEENTLLTFSSENHFAARIE